MPRTIFFAQNQSANGVVTGAPVTKRAEFLAAIPATTIGNQAFDPPGVGSPIALSWPGGSGTISATATGVGLITAVGTAGAAFNTSGTGSAVIKSDLSWQINFATPIAALGFYGVDIGDTGGFEDPGQLSIVLRDTLGVDETFVVPHTLPGNQGNLLFWGVIDTDKQYSRVSFVNSNGDGMQSMGFDDMVVADASQVQPVVYWPAGCSAWPGGAVAR